MSVTATINLPEAATYIALGGNGFTAPKGMYTVSNFVSTGDASGGAHQLNIVMDPTYTSMVGYASMNSNPVAAIVLRWTLVGPVGGSTPLQVRNLLSFFSSSTINAATVNDLWVDMPALILPGGDDQVPTLSITVVNADGINVQLHAVIFIYDIRAREDARYGQLVASRGGI